METKGEKTKQLILGTAYRLFAEYGFTRVNMKMLCERTGLSRGGLYRHYESTAQIFLEILRKMAARQQDEVREQIAKKVPAKVILESLLSRYEMEMRDDKNSLSLAIVEFYGDSSHTKEDGFVKQSYERSKATWIELIAYGVATKEFMPVDAEAVFHVIVFAYQGVRLYSRLMDIEDDVSSQIVKEVKRLLLPQEERNEKR